MVYDGVQNVLVVLGHWDVGRDSQPIHQTRTYCPLSHHHLSGGSGGQLHQLGSKVSLYTCLSNGSLLQSNT